mgnify:CR=1 FL=1
MRKPVITGVSVATSIGSTTEEYWEKLNQGACGIARIDRYDASTFPVQYAGMVQPFEGETVIRKRLVPQTDRMTRIALACAAAAIDDAHLDLEAADPYDVGLAITSSTGGLEFGQTELGNLWRDGWESVSPYMSFAWYYAVNTGQVSIANGLRGPGCVTLSEQAGGLDSIAHAARRLAKGTAAMIVGGIDSMLCPYGLAILGVAKGINRTMDPSSYRPFSPESAGYFPGEGGAIMVLERWDHTNPARAYAQVSGYAAAFDPNEGSDAGYLAAVRGSLARAELAARDIDLVFADGWGAPEPDAVEAATLTDLFGDQIPVTVPKVATGRLLGGGGSTDVAAASLALKEQVIPPCPKAAGGQILDASLPGLVTASTPAELGNVLVVSRGHGGFVSALVLSRVS